MHRFIVLLFLILIMGCGSLPKNLQKLALNIPKVIKYEKGEIAKRKNWFENFKKSSNFKDFKIYSDREKWDNKFSSAESKIKLAENSNKSIIAFLDRNNPKEEKALRLALKTANQLIFESKNLSKTTKKRIDFLTKMMKNSTSVLKEAVTNYNGISKVYSDLAKHIKSVQANYPKKKKDIDRRFVPITTIYKTSQDKLSTVQSELKSKTTDWAVFGDAYMNIDKQFSSIISENKKIRASLGELSKSYSKVLIDMKTEFYVTVGRTTWDSGSDWNTEKQHTWIPKQVNEKTYGYFSNYSGSLAATQWGSNINCDKSMWNALGINIKSPSFPRYHDGYEVWLADTPMKYYHKYNIIQGSTESKTRWAIVTEKVFENNTDNLGMAIVSKPFGSYESESLKQASPPGMAYVGNKKYGTWKKDKSGTSFWAFYGQYMFISHMMGPSHYYYRSDYNAWNGSYRGQRPYYGSTTVGNRTTNRYGTSSASTQKNYATSNYSKTGGFQKSSSSVRGAGKSSRSKGAGKGK